MSATQVRGDRTGRAAGTQVMRAAVHQAFGGPEVVRVETVRRPVARSGELLVRVHASDVSVADHRMRARDLPGGFAAVAPLVVGFRRPRRAVLGMEVAGVVAEVGDGVTGFRPGDRVAALTGGHFGGHADYARVRAGVATHVPDGMRLDDAVALLFGGHTALPFLRAAGVGPGQEVLVNGASGAVGVMAVQLAAHLGARVTAVCSARNAELVRGLGADVVLDYAQVDFTTAGTTYDVVVECVGNAPYRTVRPVVRRGGALVVVVGGLGDLLAARWRHARSGLRIVTGSPRASADHLAELVGLAHDGAIRPVIDRTYDLEEVVEAHRYVDTGRKRGAVVLRVRAEA